MKNALRKRKLQLLSWILAIAVFTAQLGLPTVAYAAQVNENEITNETQTDTSEEINEETSKDSTSSLDSNLETDSKSKTKDFDSSAVQAEETQDTDTTESLDSSNETGTTDSTPLSSSLTAIEELLTIAVTDGSQAGTLLNAYTDLTAFEDGVRQVLEQYYTDDPNNQLSAFEEAIDERADEIVENYKNAALERAREAELNYVPGEIIVVFEDDIESTDEAMEVAEELEETKAGTFQILDNSLEEEIGVVEISLEQTVEQAIETYSQDENIAYAQPNYLYSLPDSTATTEALTNDPYGSYDYQWHLKNIYASSAWDYMKKCTLSKVRVAVLDTGVDTSHPDLQATLNKNLCMDVTKSPYVKSTTDDDGHGTHVAGIIGATSNNGLGGTGVATGASNDILDLMVVDVFTQTSDGLYAYTSNIINGLNYAYSNGAKVINLSLGMYFEDKLLESNINFVTQKGTLVVCAAGNGNEFSNGYGYDDKNLPCYPSDFEAVISVIATDSNNKRAYFSNYGDAKDISAPGSSIISTWPGSAYAISDGTSMAAPIVTAIAAMALSIKPALTPDKLKSILYSTATDIYSSGWDRQSGYGVVNAYKVVTTAANASSATGISLSNTSITCGASKTLKPTLSPVYTTDSVTWTSSNSSIVAVNSTTGRITAKQIGKATITATTGSGKTASCVITVNLGKPTVKLKSTTYKRITISWNKVAGSYKYIVYRAASKNGKYKKLTTTTSTSYADKNVKLGKKYYYKVKAVAKNGTLTQTKLSAHYKATPKVSKVTSLSAKATSKTQIRLTWKKVSGATQYYIYRATSKNGKYKYIGKSTSTKYNSKSLKSKRTYYYKIVAARTSGKKTYKSARSSIVSAKTK